MYLVMGYTISVCYTVGEMFLFFMVREISAMYSKTHWCSSVKDIRSVVLLCEVDSES